MTRPNWRKHHILMLMLALPGMVLLSACGEQNGIPRQGGVAAMAGQSLSDVILACLIAINVVTFFMYGIDKWKAKRGKWRISEAALLGMAVIGGSVGAWLGMRVWHHKTMHKKFRYGIPLILLAQVALILLTACKTKQKTVSPVQVQAHKHVPEHSPNVFLVMYDEQTGKAPLEKAIKDYKCEVVYDYRMMAGMALRKPEDKTLEETMEHFRRVKGVVSVEYDHIIRLDDPVRPRLEVK